MDLNDKIAVFLENGASDYDYGILLLRKVCRNQGLVQSISKKHTSAHQAKLIYELEKHLTNENYNLSDEKEKILREEHIETNKREPESASGIEVQRRTILAGSINENHEQSGKKGSDKSLPAVFNQRDHVDHSDLDRAVFRMIEKLTIERNSLYGERDHYHGQLTIVDSEKARHELAINIHGIQPKIDKINTKIDYMKQTGQIHPSLVQSRLSIDQFKRLKLVETYITKYKKLLTSVSDISEKKRHEEKLEKYQAEKKQILNHE